MVSIFIHWFTILALCALVGGLALAPFTMRSTKAAVAREFAELAQRKWLSFWLIACVLVIIPAALLRAPGWVLFARLLLLVLLAELLKRRREATWPALVVGAALLLTQSLGSRSARLPDELVPTLADWVHLTLAATWLGGVAMLLVVVRAVTQRGRPADMQPSIVSSLSYMADRFSPVALFCALGLAMTGIAQAGMFLKGFEDLWATAFGRALALKAILFVVLIGFGAFHQQVIAPALRRAIMGRGGPQTRPYDNTLARFRLSLLLETLVGAGLLAAVGLLVSTAI